MSTHHLAVTRHLCLLLSLILLPACASEQDASLVRINRMLADLCPHWSLGVTAPRFMEAWVEDIQVIDARGNIVPMSVGMAGSTGQVDGWGSGTWSGNSATVNAAGLPQEITIRWQSLAEPQTYTWHFAVPEGARRSLGEKVPVTWQGKPGLSCRSNITIGVAPGGRAIVWTNGYGFQPLAILRGQAEVEPLGPGQGWGKGYAYPLSDEAKKYVEEHGIPYGSWDQ
jgi:hypothetical protein